MDLCSADIDLDVVQKRLEEAGLYDKNLDRNEMISYYQALKDSEIMALEEDQGRKELFSEDDSNESVATATSSNFVPKKFMADKKPILELDLNSSDNSDIPKVSIREKLNLTARQQEFRKKLDSLHPFLEDDFMGKSHDERAEIFLKFHIETRKIQAQQARCFLRPAPTPKIITPTSCSSDSYFDKSDDVENTYTCRSGRHTKRKNYSEELFDSICTVNKKTKVDEDDDWLNKNNNKSPTKPTPRPALSSLRKQEEEQSSSNENHPTTPKSATRTPNRKKLSNDEIMSRSSLFADVSRKGVLMENARVEAEKKRQEEQEMDCFEKTLVTEEKVESQEIIQVDDEPVKRRVEPKLPAGMRRGGGRKRTKINENQLDVTIEPSTSNKTEQKTVKKPTPPKKISNNVDVENVVTVKCPICSKVFSASDIQTHASACGETQDEIQELNAQLPSLRSKRGTIVCEVCDKVFLMDKNYEVHVNECIAIMKNQSE